MEFFESDIPVKNTDDLTYVARHNSFPDARSTTEPIKWKFLNCTLQKGYCSCCLENKIEKFVIKIKS